MQDEALGRIVARLQVALDPTDVIASDEVEYDRSHLFTPVDGQAAERAKDLSVVIECLLADGIAAERVIDVVLESTTPHDRWKIAREAIVCDVAARLCNDLDTPHS